MTESTIADLSLRTLSSILKNVYPVECPQTEKSTLRKMSTVVARWGALMPPVPVDSIDRARLLEFRNTCRDLGLAASTVNSHVRVIITLGRVAGVKIDGARLQLQIRTDPLPTPTLDELNRAWKITSGAAWPMTRKSNGRAMWCGISPAMWWRGVFMLAFSTGLRRSDLFGLQWTDIEEDRIPTKNRKTKKFQYLPIPEPLRPWLDLLRKQGEKTVLGRNDRRKQLDRELRHMAQLCEVKELGLQSFRRASARAYERAHPGCGRLILNHGKSVTERYYLDVYETLSEAATKLTYPDEFLRPINELLGEELEVPTSSLSKFKSTHAKPPAKESSSLIFPAAGSSRPMVQAVSSDVINWEFI